MFHPSRVVAPATNKDDDGNSGEDDLEYLENAPINTAAV